MDKIEEIVASALGNAVDREYEAKVKHIDFNPGDTKMADATDTTEILIWIKKKDFGKNVFKSNDD